MARLVKATCPNCGAGIKLDPAQDFVTCGFCNTSSFIQRSATPERPEPPRPPPPGTLTIQLSELTIRSGPDPTRLIVPIVVAVFALTGLIAWFVTRQSGESEGFATQSARWVLVDDPLLGDVNGDGVVDFASMTMTIGGGTEYRPRAFDGRDGKELWVADPLPWSAGSTISAVAGSRYYFVSDAQLTGLDLSTGAKVFGVSLPERVKQVCEHGSGVALWTKDDQLYSVDSASGALTRAGVVNPQALWVQRSGRPRGSNTETCVPAMTNQPQTRGPRVSVVSSIGLTCEEVSGHQALIYGDQPPYVLVGTRRTGSRVPRVAAHDGQKTLWATDVPAENPMSAKEGEPKTATIAQGRVIAAYEVVSGTPSVRVACFELATGKRQWEVDLGTKEVAFASLAASNRHVFYHAANLVVALSLTDGRVLYRVGKDD